MKKIACFAFSACGAAYGLGINAGGFFVLSAPLGEPMAEAFDVVYGLSAGVGGKVSFNCGLPVFLEAGAEYHMGYPGRWPSGFDAPTSWDAGKLTAVPVTLGAAYELALGKFRPRLYGGGVYVLEYYDIYKRSAPEPADKKKPGVYAGAGIAYFASEDVSWELNPRWLLVFDREESYAGLGEYSAPSQFLDVLLGLTYHFL